MVDFEHPSENKVRKILKILVVGDMGTGKTSLIRQYVHGFFSEFYKSTIGVDFAHKDYVIDDSLTVNIQLWDISGQERFGSVTHLYYQDAVGALITFDVSNPKTLDVVKIWKKDIDEKVFTTEDKPIPCLLIGNKIDLAPNGWEKSPEEMEQFWKENAFVGYFETSALDGTNVQNANEFLARYIVENKIEGIHPKELEKCVDIEQEVPEEVKEERKKCC